MKARFHVGLAMAAVAGSALGFMPIASAQYDPAPRVNIYAEQASDRAAEAVTLPRGVVEAASAYETYLRGAAAIRAGFRDEASVERAMLVGEAYQPEQLEKGLIAYAALIALEDEGFVRGVRDQVRGPGDAERAAYALQSDPNNLAMIPGSGDAAAMVRAVLRKEGGQLFETGRAVKQSAYDVQHQAWSKQDVPDPARRLAKAKSLATSAFVPAPEDVSRLLRSAAGFRGRRAGMQDGPPVLSPVIQRGLTLAALAVLGQATDERRLTQLFSEPRGADCMKMAKLNLYQCLAVAGPHYEDIFCLGQHALMDTGQCLASGGGSPLRIETSLPRN